MPLHGFDSSHCVGKQVNAVGLELRRNCMFPCSPLEEHNRLNCGLIASLRQRTTVGFLVRFNPNMRYRMVKANNIVPSFCRYCCWLERLVAFIGEVAVGSVLRIFHFRTEWRTNRVLSARAVGGQDHVNHCMEAWRLSASGGVVG